MLANGSEMKKLGFFGLTMGGIPITFSGPVLMFFSIFYFGPTNIAIGSIPCFVLYAHKSSTTTTNYRVFFPIPHDPKIFGFFDNFGVWKIGFKLGHISIAVVVLYDMGAKQFGA